MIRKLYALFLHIWFYVLILVATVVLSPLLTITLIREKDYPKFFWLARNLWANSILYGMGMIPKISKQVDIQNPCVLISNHTSMLDIMLMYRVSKTPFVFIGKKELADYPIFGFFYKKVSIVVDRKNVRSGYSAYKNANKYIKKGYSICIFPEGGIPNPDITLDNFKDGAFRLALDNKIPITVISFKDNKRRMPYNLFEGNSGIVRASVIECIDTNNMKIEDKNIIKNKCRELILASIS